MLLDAMLPYPSFEMHFSLFMSHHLYMQAPSRQSYPSYLPPVNTNGLLFSSFSFKYSYTVKVTAWPGATRMTRGVIPL